MENLTLAKRENYASWRTDTSDYLNKTIDKYDSYWIIDPCASPELPGVLWDIGPDLIPMALYLNTYLEEAMWAGPIIMPYNPKHSINTWLFNRIGLLPIGYLIQINSEHKDELYDHLQNLIECISPNGNRTIFRFYDPRIMFSICTYSDKMILEQILGPIAYLYGWEHGRRCSIHAGDGNDHLYRCLGDVEYNDIFFRHIWKEVRIHTLIQLYREEFLGTHPDSSFFELYDEIEYTYKFLASNNLLDTQSFDLATAFTASFPSCIWKLDFVVEAFAELPEKTNFVNALMAIGGEGYV